MDNNLEALARAHADLQGTRNGFTLIKQRWYSWNYWAQHHAKFSMKDWMVENNVEFEDIQAKTHYPDVEIVLSRDEGYKYYSAWRGAQYALKQAEEEFDHLFYKFWGAVDPSNGRYLYTPEQIGKAIGKDTEQLRKFAAKRPWYSPRTKGTK